MHAKLSQPSRTLPGGPVAASPVIRLRSNRSRAWGRFKRDPAAVGGLILLLAMLAASLAGPLVYTQDPYQTDLGNVLGPPSRSHPFGTDGLGRDLLSRILYGGRISISLGVIVVLIAMVLGTLVGIVSGFVRGWVDEVAMRLTDVAMAFPGFLLALLMLSVLGPGLYQAMVAVGLSYVPRFVRLTRASTLSAREQEYVTAATVVGQRSSVILSRHILPNILAPIVVQATLLVGMAILIAASLGFLGLGVRPPTAEWGNMMSESRDYLRIAPHVAIFPGLAILVVVLAFNLVGDGLRIAFDVQLT